MCRVGLNGVSPARLPSLVGRGSLIAGRRLEGREVSCAVRAARAELNSGRNLTSACTRPESACMSSLDSGGFEVVCGRVMPGVRWRVVTRVLNARPFNVRRAARAVESGGPCVVEPGSPRPARSGVARLALDTGRSRRQGAPPSNIGMHPTANRTALIEKIRGF